MPPLRSSASVPSKKMEITMEEPKPLDSLFKEKIFRIPDYQRGYAWQQSQLKDFWEDLINLGSERSHYTGVLTLKELSKEETTKFQNEYWLIDDHSYKIFHIVDGQQRLTTFVIFLQAFIDFIKSLPENIDTNDSNIFITDSLNIESIIDKYLYKIKPTGNEYRTYKFGYTVDNPSYNYLRYKIFKESGSGSIDETFYTLNLKNSWKYFFEQIEELYKHEGVEGLKDIYKKLTKQFLFNEYIIKDEFDVFVAFETMNNRGKKLSDLELLKNRLIYLTTLYSENEIDFAERINIRDDINSSWKEVYHQLGKNEKRPLNDDDFLKAHWILYFKYSRKRGNDYIEFLLNEQFSPKKIHKKIEKEVALELPEVQEADFEAFESDVETGEANDDAVIVTTALLEPIEIKNYVNNLKSAALHWFNSYFPTQSTLDEKVQNYIDKLNRIGMGYFRPLVMAFLKNESDSVQIIKALKLIERFIFIEFRLNQTRRNYRDSEFYNYARELDRGDITIDNICDRISELVTYNLNEDGSYKIDYFYNYLKKRFESGGYQGYYGWHGLRYFLFEYELSLLSSSRQRKVFWEDLIKTPKDNISIEHIFPQTPSNEYWKTAFSSISKKDYYRYQGSLGNLLLLSHSINSSLQNDGFADKKRPRFNDNKEKIRNGYSDGSHSEIEVANELVWNPENIRKRGMKLLCFMEKRWNIKFKNDEERESLLFL
jgi:uncharacterized protein with ParB-like and HNH nuclease domain